MVDGNIGSPGDRRRLQQQEEKFFRLSEHRKRKIVTKGVIYHAAGNKYVAEAEISAISARRKTPSIKTALRTGLGTNPEFDRSFDVFVSDEQIDTGDWPHPFMLDKIDWLLNSPFEQSLFLDTDTYVCGDIESVFLLLEGFDVAVSPSESISHIQGLPGVEYLMPDLGPLPEFQCGAILFRKSDATTELFESWKRIYESQLKEDYRPIHDQPAFRRALSESKARFAPLPPEYHCRVTSGGYLSGSVKIIHGRHPDLAALSREINAITRPRIHWYSHGRLFVYPSRHKLRTLLSLLRPDRLLALVRQGFFR